MQESQKHLKYYIVEIEASRFVLRSLHHCYHLADFASRGGFIPLWSNNLPFAKLHECKTILLPQLLLRWKQDNNLEAVSVERYRRHTCFITLFNEDWKQIIITIVLYNNNNNVRNIIIIIFLLLLLYYIVI